MSSLVELKDAAIDKALEVIRAIEVDGDETHNDSQKSSTAVNLTNVAVTAAAQINQDTWAPQTQVQEGASRG